MKGTALDRPRLSCGWMVLMTGTMLGPLRIPATRKPVRRHAENTRSGFSLEEAQRRRGDDRVGRSRSGLGLVQHSALDQVQDLFSGELDACSARG